MLAYVCGYDHSFGMCKALFSVGFVENGRGKESKQAKQTWSIIGMSVFKLIACSSYIFNPHSSLNLYTPAAYI